jgi:hypothetical protein
MGEHGCADKTHEIFRDTLLLSLLLEHLHCRRWAAVLSFDLASVD